MRMIECKEKRSLLTQKKIERLLFFLIMIKKSTEGQSASFFFLSSCMHSYRRVKDRGGRGCAHLFPGNGQSDLGFIASFSLSLFRSPSVPRAEYLRGSRCSCFSGTLQVGRVCREKKLTGNINLQMQNAAVNH